MSKYLTKNHSKFSIKYHIILVVKYRKKLLTHPLSERMKEIIVEISNRPDGRFSILEMEADEDHLHILIDTEPQICSTSIIRRIKKISTKEIWKCHGRMLMKEFWYKEMFWSDGYFVCTTGEASSATIKRYIENQG